jgi:hypothetical protein
MFKFEKYSDYKKSNSKMPNIENVRILEKFRNNGPAKPINQRRKPKKNPHK